MSLIHIKKVVGEIIISWLLKYWPLSDKFNSINWNAQWCVALMHINALSSL